MDLTEALWHDEETFGKVGVAICRWNWEETLRLLEGAAKKSRGKRKERIIKLIRYLQENWAGVINSPGAKRLGAKEGQIQHNIARRMKRLGARWTVSGGDCMARVLAAKANGELEQYIWRWPVERQRLKEVAKAKEKVEEKPKVEDIGMVAGILTGSKGFICGSAMGKVRFTGTYPAQFFGLL